MIAGMIGCGGGGHAQSHGLPMMNHGLCTATSRMIDGACYCAEGTAWNGVACIGTPVAGTCTAGRVEFQTPHGQRCDCTGDMSWNGAQCALPNTTCANGAVWDGTGCACPAGTSWNGTVCMAPCPATTAWDGAQCACPAGTSWDGNQCAPPAQPQ